MAHSMQMLLCNLWISVFIIANLSCGDSKSPSGNKRNHSDDAVMAEDAKTENWNLDNIFDHPLAANFKIIKGHLENKSPKLALSDEYVLEEILLNNLVDMFQSEAYQERHASDSVETEEEAISDCYEEFLNRLGEKTPPQNIFLQDDLVLAAKSDFLDNCRTHENQEKSSYYSWTGEMRTAYYVHCNSINLSDFGKENIFSSETDFRMQDCDTSSMAMALMIDFHADLIGVLPGKTSSEKTADYDISYFMLAYETGDGKCIWQKSETSGFIEWNDSCRHEVYYLNRFHAVVDTQRNRHKEWKLSIDTSGVKYSNSPEYRFPIEGQATIQLSNGKQLDLKFTGTEIMIKYVDSVLGMYVETSVSELESQYPSES